jgi:hypothetical protein
MLMFAEGSNVEENKWVERGLLSAKNNSDKSRNYSITREVTT